MNPRRKKVDSLLKFREPHASYLAFGIVAAVIGAFVVGTIAVRAEDVLTPPTALFPDQGKLPDLGGGSGGAGNLLDVLKGGSVAEWSKFKEDTVIGGRLGLGQVISGGGKLQLSYPLDIQVDYNPSDTEDSHDTAIIRLAGQNENPNSANKPRMWTGLQLARMDRSITDMPFTEKWFIGMSEENDHFIIRANGGDTDASKRVNIVDIDPDKGAACFGAMYVGQTQNSYSGKVGGYIRVNELCSNDNNKAHVCSEEEIMRTIICAPLELPKDKSAWINKGTPGYTNLQSNDCNGWTTDSSDFRGGIWQFDANGGIGMLNTCAGGRLAKKFACCR